MLNNNEIKFTDDQEQAVKKLIEFINSPFKKTFGLYGFSGTGKTTIVTELVSYLFKQKQIQSVAFTAPTNKAVNVMKSKFELFLREIYYQNTNKTVSDNYQFDNIVWELNNYGITIDFITTHKLLKFETDFDSNGKLIFKKNKATDIWKYNIIIIDECSMLSGQIVDYIFNDIGNDFRKIKIIFSGDPAQLNPVNGKNSIIFSKKLDDFPFDVYLLCLGFADINVNDVFMKLKIEACRKRYTSLMENIIGMDYFIMRQVVRTKSTNIIGLCSIMRDWTLGNSENKNIKKYIDNRDCYAYKYQSNTSKTSTEWFKKFLESCIDFQDSIILAWTNKQCHDYNNVARKELFGTNNLEQFKVGDILILNDYYSIKGSKLDESKFYTSEQIKVVNIEIINKRIEKFPACLDSKSQKLEHSNVYEQLYKKLIDKIAKKTNTEYKCWKLKAKRFSSTQPDNVSELYVIHEDDRKKYEDDIEYISKGIRKLRITLVMKYKEKTQTIENNVVKQLWKVYYSIYIYPFANVNYGYSITCHKAQGSTFCNVFIDMEDITKNQNENEMKKCLYTAISRTANKLFLLI